MTEPEVINTTVINEGGLDEVIECRLGYRLEITLGGIDGSGVVEPWPKTVGQNIMQNDNTITCYVTAFTVGPGNLYLPVAGGTIPLEYNNTLLTSGSVIIDSDLFV